jgi:predicted regulator of Ras-like GTPase activity (Roadblock/LC7/MglB family)
MDELRLRATRLAEAILGETHGVSAVLAATVDGFELGGATSAGLDPARVAALASSMSAIGDVVAAEARMGASKCVTVETQNGFLLVQSIPRTPTPLVITVVAGEGAVLGLVKVRVAAAARELAE